MVVESILLSNFNLRISSAMLCEGNGVMTGREIFSWV